EGLFFYFLAGFFTTRRGGSITRALRTGFWAGIISTIFFWIVLPVGLLFQAMPTVQNILNADQASGIFRNQNTLLGDVINRIKPDFLNASSTSNAGQSGSGFLLALALIGLAASMIFALLGGFAGSRGDDHRI
ncbi:MAG: hypothetical protein ACRDHW_09330, partial [Ktedonobacteraceae bacterium]